MPLTTLDPQTALIVVDLQKGIVAPPRQASLDPRPRVVTQVVVIGVATGTGVAATARQAYEQGFSVTLAIDAMTDVRKSATTQDIIDPLGQRSA